MSIILVEGYLDEVVKEYGLDAIGVNGAVEVDFDVNWLAKTLTLEVIDDKK